MGSGPIQKVSAMPFGGFPMPHGTLSVSDGVDTNYRFTVYDIRAVPAAVDAVYIFARREGNVYVPLYIGRAEFLSRRLRAHERLPDALKQGATHLLVHQPGHLPRVSYKEAERRLIHRYTPALNEQYNSRNSA